MLFLRLFLLLGKIALEGKNKVRKRKDERERQTQRAGGESPSRRRFPPSKACSRCLSNLGFSWLSLFFFFLCFLGTRGCLFSSIFTFTGSTASVSTSFLFSSGRLDSFPCLLPTSTTSPSLLSSISSLFFFFFFCVVSAFLTSSDDYFILFCCSSPRIFKGHPQIFSASVIPLFFRDFVSFFFFFFSIEKRSSSLSHSPSSISPRSTPSRLSSTIFFFFSFFF